MVEDMSEKVTVANFRSAANAALYVAELAKVGIEATSRVTADSRYTIVSVSLDKASEARAIRDAMPFIPVHEPEVQKTGAPADGTK
jgi:hypothetical protein